MAQRKIKVGIVGCGVVATAYYLPFLMKMETVTVQAVCDRFSTRTAACARLFGAPEQYQDYDDMIDHADIEAMFILTAPGTHVRFALKAIAAGKHVLVQKPMATTMEDARKIADAVRAAKVKALIEPSSNTRLDPDTALLRDLVCRGVLGEVLWFSLAYTGPTTYGPTQIVGVLGSCKSVMATARIGVTDHMIVPESQYDVFLAQATDPDHANYWDAVLDLPRTQRVRMEHSTIITSRHAILSSASSKTANRLSTSTGACTSPK